MSNKALASLRTLIDQGFTPSVDERGDQIAADMVGALPTHLAERLFQADKEALGKIQKQELLTAILLGAMESPTFLRALGTEMAAKPLEAVRNMVNLMPKTATIEGNLKHTHAIVVPQEIALAHWEKAPEDRIIDELPWTDDLSDTPFGGE